MKKSIKKIGKLHALTHAHFFLFCLFLVISFPITSYAAASHSTIKKIDWRVGRIAIHDSIPFERFRLKRYMNLNRKPFKRSPTFAHHTLSADVETMQYTLRKEGFLRAEIVVDSIYFDSTKNRVDVAISVHHKRQTFVSSVTISGTEVFSDSVYHQTIGVTKAKQPLNISRLEQDRLAILTLLANAGFLESKADYALSLSPDSLTAKVQFIIDEKQAIIVDTIIFEGLHKVRPWVVAKECTFSRGDTLTQKRIRSTADKLYKTGLFTFATVRFAPNPGLGPSSTRTISVIVQEKKYLHVEFGAGFQSYEKARISSMLGYDNFFGLGYKAAVGGKLSFVQQSAEASATLPRLVGIPVNASISGALRHQNDNVYEGIFKEFRSGLSNEITEFTTWYGGYRFEKVAIVRSVSPDSLPKNTSSLNTRIQLDKRDNIINPRQGIYLHAEAEGSGVLRRNNNRYLLCAGGINAYTTFGTPFVFASGIALGIASPFGSDTAIPVQERFYLGGSRELRGYGEKQAGQKSSDGTPIGGNAYVSLHLCEIRFPIYRILGGAIFSDAGNIWYNPKSSLLDALKLIDISKLSYSIGSGLRIKTPIGIVRLDAAYTLRSKTDLLKTVFYIDIGQAF